jgi:hypothetical protein
LHESLTPIRADLTTWQIRANEQEQLPAALFEVYSSCCQIFILALSDVYGG